jgi:hypothetical protein
MTYKEKEFWACNKKNFVVGKVKGTFLLVK